MNKKCFSVHSRQSIECKAYNKIAPYITVKQERAHYFQFIFTDTSDSLDLVRQLHRASTLDYEHEDLMLQLILKSRMARAAKFDVHYLEDAFREQIQFEADVQKIQPLVANPGRVVLTNACLYYKPFNNLDGEKQIVKVRLKNIVHVIKRRYHLKRIGCEIVFEDEAIDSHTSLPYLYLTFEDEERRDAFYTKLVLDQGEKLIRLDQDSHENMLQKWRYGAISNFDYLIYLNNMSDRSYNDLTQYPVFPWVLTDYTSQTLDLTDPSIFRDLSKPVGALQEDRLQRLKQRCKEMSSSVTSFSSSSSHPPKQFLYGSHYSTPAYVSFYLVRQQPEWQLCLQNGRFDHPNRLFHSIADTWHNCLHLDSNVKELLPEFYDTSTANALNGELGAGFLRNHLELDFGVRQDGVRVDHVILPPWANNSTEQFVRKMREALESPIVSESLHQWIDLIFGYKQRGEEALKADNLFYYLCYEGGVDLASISNYSERRSLEIQIQVMFLLKYLFDKYRRILPIVARHILDLK